MSYAHSSYPEMSITRFQDKGGIVDLGIKGKKVLVTGTGRGLGYAIALTLAEEGAKVAAISRKRENLDKLMEEIGGTENGHYVIACNLTEEGAPQKILEELNDNFGFIDILVNNLGGTLDIVDPLCSIQDWRDIFRFNLEVAIELNNLVIPKMKELGWGRIVNIGGLSGHIGAKSRAHVVTSKAALVGLTKAISMEFLEKGVTCNCVVPGFIVDFDSKETSLKGHWLKHPQTPNLALNRFGKPDEVAEVIANLCKKERPRIGRLILHH